MTRYIDISGSGLKTALFIEPEWRPMPHYGEGETRFNNLQHFEKPDYANFFAWLKANSLLDGLENLYVSCAGYVSHRNTRILKSNCTGWTSENTKWIREVEASNIKIKVMNDAVAHLGCQLFFDNGPVLCITLGSSIGVAFSSKYQHIFSPDDYNLDVGELILNTSCSNKEAWFALGSKGLQELELSYAGDAYEKFGYRLGSFCAVLSNIFRPATIFISGGIMQKHGEKIITSCKAEYNQQYKNPVHWLPINIFTMHQSKYNALIGLSNYHQAKYDFSKRV
jgi:hypothetical protein